MTPVRLYCNTLSPQFCAPPLQQATWASLPEKLQLCLFEKTKGVMEPPPHPLTFLTLCSSLCCLLTASEMNQHANNHELIPVHHAQLCWTSGPRSSPAP